MSDRERSLRMGLPQGCNYGLKLIGVWKPTSAWPHLPPAYHHQSVQGSKLIDGN